MLKTFLTWRAGWLITHIYEHYTFELEKFKKEIVVMNQKSSQKATSSVEKDFFKLLNNSNFGIDYFNNCILEPLYDDLAEIPYTKNFTTIFNDDIFRHFLHQFTWGKKLFKPFKLKVLPLTTNKNDPCYEATRECYNKMEEELHSVNSWKI